MLFRLFTILALALLLPVAVVTASFAQNSPEKKAIDLINALGCKGCHKIQGDGGQVAPELDAIGSRMTRAQISEHLAAHSEERKQGFMPSYNTTSKEELDTLSDFLYNLK